MSTWITHDDSIAKLTGTSPACAFAAGAAAIFTFVSVGNRAGDRCTENTDMNSRSGKAWSTTRGRERPRIMSGRHTPF